jgi:hypothetical protein
MARRCDWCGRPGGVVRWVGIYGPEFICTSCAGPTLRSSRPKRNRRRPQRDPRQLLFPFMSETH